MGTSFGADRQGGTRNDGGLLPILYGDLFLADRRTAWHQHSAVHRDRRLQPGGADHRIDRSPPAERAVRALDQIIEWRGKPRQNAYIERDNRTVRYDWLSHYLFESIGEVQDHVTDWRWSDNRERLNMALGGITPKQKLVLLTPSTSDRRYKWGDYRRSGDIKQISR